MLNVHSILPQEALLSIAEITLLLEMLIPAQAVYVVSVDEIVLPSAAIWILLQAINSSCFQLHSVLSPVLSAKSLISKSQAT